MSQEDENLIEEEPVAAEEPADETVDEETPVAEEEPDPEEKVVTEAEPVTEEATDVVPTDAVPTESVAVDTESEVKKETENTPTPKNNKNRNVAIVVVIIVIVLAVIVLLKVNDVIGSGAGGDAGGSAQGEVAEGVVAKVGNAEITQDLVDRESALVLYNDYGETFDVLSPEELVVFKNQILVYFLVQAELIKEHLNEQGTGTLSEEQRAAISSAVDNYYASIENPEETLGAMNVERADVEYFLELNEYLTLYQAEVIQANPITDAEARQFYDENAVYFAVPLQISASHILIMDADHTPEKRAELEAILERARDGEDFAELAKEYSEDTGSAVNGGDVGYFGESNNFVPEFSAAALALENVGDISEIVETEYGYHIIQLTDKQDATTQAFEEVKAEIVSYLEEVRTSEAAAALKNEIAVTYYVEVDPATGEPPITLPPAAEPEAGTVPEIVPLPE